MFLGLMVRVLAVVDVVGPGPEETRVQATQLQVPRAGGQGVSCLHSGSRPYRNHGWSSKTAGSQDWWSGCPACLHLLSRRSLFTKVQYAQHSEEVGRFSDSASHGLRNQKTFARNCPAGLLVLAVLSAIDCKNLHRSERGDTNIASSRIPG